VAPSLTSKHVIKLDNLGFRLGYRPIGKHRSNALVEPDFMHWDPLIDSMLSLVLIALMSFTRCYNGLMMCSLHLDEFTTRVESCTAVTSLCNFLSSWTICLIVWIIDT
jgi:hypothetical protein